MASIQKTVRNMKNILSSLSSDEELDLELVENLSKAYEDAFVQAADKANRCLELLHEGSRSKALQLAMQEPDLRSQFEAIDFDERLEWLDLCEKRGIEYTYVTTSNINVCSAIISKVYRNTDKLTDLLRIHRSLALRRAPMSSRLKILRLIYREDQINGLWAEDIRSHENAYLEELSKAAGIAKGEGDLERLEEILKELTSKEWLIRLPSHLISAVKKYTSKNRQIYADIRFNELVEKIHQAHSLMDESECRQLLIRWREIAKRFAVHPPPQLAEKVLPAKEWLNGLQDVRDEDNAFREACKALEEAIDEKETLDTLEKLAADILSFDRGMPELLAARFNSKMEAMKLKRKRIFTLILSVIISCLILVSTAIAFVFIQHDRKQELKRWSIQIEGALKNNDLDSAGKLLTQIEREEARIFSSPEIRRLAAQYERELKSQQQRQEYFNTILASFKEVRVESLDTGLLEKAEEMARGPEEKSLVFVWRKKYQTYLDNEIQKLEKAFEDQLVQLENLYEKFSNSDKSDLPNYLKLSRRCLDLADQLVVMENISPVLLTRARTVKQAVLEAALSAHDNAEKERLCNNHLSRIGRRYDNSKELSDDLRSFSETYPEHILSADFTRALTKSKQWESIDVWNGFVNEWHTNVTVGEIEVAESRLKQINACLEEYPDSPCRKKVLIYCDYLKVAESMLRGSRLRNPGSLETSLREPLISDAFMIKDKDGACYYMLENTFKKSGTVYRFSYIVDAAMNTRKTSLNEARINTHELSSSPQSRFAEKALTAIEKYRENSSGWETLYLELAVMCGDNNEMDPILSANLLKVLLRHASDNTPFGKDRIEQILQEFNNDETDVDVAWMNPRDSRANKSRSQISNLVKKEILRIKTLLQDTNKWRKDMKNSFTPYKLGGIFLGEQNNVILTHDIKKGELFVAGTNKDKETVFVTIGAIVSNKPVLNGQSPLDYPQGTPVFVRPLK